MTTYFSHSSSIPVRSFHHTMMSHFARQLVPWKKQKIKARFTVLLVLTVMISLGSRRSVSALGPMLSSSSPMPLSSSFATGVSTTRQRMAITSSISDDESSSYTKSYRLDGVGEGSRVDIRTSTGHNLSTDVPRSMGGGDTAPQPVETLLAAWMGCTQATAIFVGRQLQWNTETTTAVVSTESTTTTTTNRQRPLRVHIQKLHFENIQAFRDERGALQLPIIDVPDIPSRIQRITGTIRVELAVAKMPSSRQQRNPPSNSGGIDEVKGDESPPLRALSESQLQTLRDQTEARCPVANMIIASGCDVDVEWTNYSIRT